jgi:putative ABC transport system ATP-binding protein
VIELRGVSRVFEVGDAKVHALKDVSLRIVAGEHVALMGPSGSGKSTLLNIVGCLDRPSAGTYVLDGEDVSSLDERALAAVRQTRIGFVFQSFHLVPRLSAAGNVELPMIFAGVEPAERKRRVAESLEAVGLSPRARHVPNQLSGGERQRVAIARAVVMKPAILLADEPTGNLDSKSGAEVLGLIESMNAAGLTLVVVTHDPEVAKRARRLVRMADGSMILDQVQAGVRLG